MWNKNQRRFHLQPRGSPLLGLCPGLTPTDCPSRGRSQMVQGTVGGRGMACDAPACAEPAWDLPQVSLSVRSSRPHQWPSTRNQATPWGPEIPAGLMGGKLRPQTCILKSSPLSLECPRSEMGSVQLESAKTRSGLRWAGPMSPL